MITSTTRINSLLDEIRMQAKIALDAGDPDREPEDQQDADPQARIDRMSDQLTGILDSVADLRRALADRDGTAWKRK